MQLPISWDRLLENHWKQITTENVTIFDKSSLKLKERTFALVFKIPIEASKEIKRTLSQSIPKHLKEKFLFQPYKGYHFSIQWCHEEELKGKEISDISAKFRNLLSKTNPIKGDFIFPLFGKAGFMGMLKTRTDQDFLLLREKVNKVWSSLGLPLGVPPKYSELAYVSLTRFNKVLTDKEKRLLKNLRVEKIPDIVLDEATLVLNDKFMTPEKTEILYKLTLGKSN